MMRRRVSTDPDRSSDAESVFSRRWQLQVLGRRVVTVSATTIVVLLSTSLAAMASGIVVVDALTSGSAGTGAAGPTDAPSSGPVGASTTSTTSPSAILSNGPDQSRAPVFPVAGGSQVGYGNFNGVNCVSASFCMAVGAGDGGAGTASFSQDGGASWASAQLPKGTPPLDAVACRDASHCVGVGQGAIARTADGGDSWSLNALPVANTTLLGVQCSSQNLCLAAGVTDNRGGADQGAIVRSTDGGSTWHKATLPLHTDGIGDVVCPTATNCIAVGADLLVSTDGGATWSFSSVPGGFLQLRTISCSSATTCVAVGPNPAGADDPSAIAIAIETTDAGKTWAPLTFPAGTATLEQVDCSTGSQCMATGLSPTPSGQAPLYQSTDGGKTWSASGSPPNGMSAIAGISCPETNRCAVVGRQGNRAPATAATSDMHTWSKSVVPATATPSATSEAQ